MSKLGEAEARLKRAVSILEQAAQVRKATSNASESQELAVVKARVAELETKSAAVAEKLDTAILRVKEILKN